MQTISRSTLSPSYAPSLPADLSSAVAALQRTHQPWALCCPRPHQPWALCCPRPHQPWALCCPRPHHPWALGDPRLAGTELAVAWDADGSKYDYGAGMHVWMNGRLVGSAPPQRRSGQPSPQRLRVAWDGSWMEACARVKGRARKAKGSGASERCAPIRSTQA